MILALVAAAMNPPAPGDIETLVAGLGSQSDYRTVEAIGRHGCRAVPALVRQLEVIRVVRVLGYEKERHPREMRVAWTIATLRHITDTDFYAPRPPRFDPDTPGGRMLAMGAPPNSTKFFGIWPSRASYYFAPPAQQRAIIEQWRRYSASGACRHARPSPDFGFWLYGHKYGWPQVRLSYSATRLTSETRETPAIRSLTGTVRIGGSGREFEPAPEAEQDRR